MALDKTLKISITGDTKDLVSETNKATIALEALGISAKKTISYIAETQKAVPATKDAMGNIIAAVPAIHKVRTEFELLGNDLAKLKQSAIDLNAAIGSNKLSISSASSTPLKDDLRVTQQLISAQEALMRAKVAAGSLTLGTGASQAQIISAKGNVEEVKVKQALKAELIKLEEDYSNKVITSQADLAKRVKDVYKQAQKDLIDIKKSTNAQLNELDKQQQRASSFVSKAGEYRANNNQAIQDQIKQNQLLYAQRVSGLTSLAAAEKQAEIDRLALDRKFLADRAALEKQTQEDLAKGIIASSSGRLSTLRAMYRKYLTDIKDMEDSATKTKIAAGIQQGVINEFTQRQQLLDKYSKLELSKREQLVKDLIALEQRKNAQLAAIARSGVSDSVIKTASTAALQQYADNKKALLETANAAETAKSKHIDLSQFILRSMIIWRTYNLILNETKQLLFTVPKIGMELESTRSILNATMGGTAGTSVALEGLHKEADRTGISISALRETWRTFSASTTIAGESINTSWKIFSDMNTVITSLHYNADKTQHIFLALAQIFNKGKVQSEELVKQLGNLLPGAFAAFAAANNKTTMQLSIDMKKGLVLAHDTIANFTDFYKERFKVSFATARLSLNSELGRMNSAFTELGETLYGLSEKGLKAATKSLTEFAKTFQDVLRNKDTWINLSKTFEAAFWASSATAIALTASKIELLGGFATAASLGLMKVQEGLSAILAFAKSPAGLAIAIGVGLWYGKEKIAGDGGKPVADKIMEDIDIMMKEIKAKDYTIPIDLRISEDAKVLNRRSAQDYLYQQQQLVQEDLAKIANSPYIGKSRKDIDSESFGATAKLVVNAAGALNFPTLSVAQLEEYNKQLKEKLADNTKITVDHIKELKNVELDKANKEASELSAKTQESMEKMRLAAMEEGAEKVKKQFEMQNSDDIANIKKNFSDASKTFEAANRDYQKLIVKAKQGTGDLLKLSSVGGKDSKIDPTVLAYKDAKEKLDVATKALSDTYEARDRLVEKYNTKELKKESDVGDKRLALAKKASEDLLKLSESEANRRANDVENQLKALEQTKDITATSAYYNAERLLIEKQIEIKKELLKTTKELLGAQQNIGNTEGTPATNLDVLNQKNSRTGRLNELAPAVVSYMMAKGWTKPQASGIAANLWEESNFRTTIGTGDGGTAKGLGQWRLDRVDTFFKMFGKPILEATMKEQLDYYDWELRNKEKTALNQMMSATSPKEAAAAGVTFERPADAAGARARRGGLAGKIFDMTGNISAASLDTLAGGESKVASIEKEIADLEARKKLTYDQQTASLKTVEEAYAKVTAQYNILTGNVKEGVEEKAALRYKDALDAANNALLNGNESEKARAVIIKQQIADIEQLTLKQLNYQKALLEIGVLQSMNSEKLNQINALEQLGVVGNVQAMLDRSTIKKNQLGLMQNELSQLTANMPAEGTTKFDEATLRVQKLKNEIEQLAITSDEILTTTASTIGDAFDKTFRGVLDGSIKAKNAFAAFGKSVLGTLQEIILKELKSQIIGMVYKGIGGLLGNAVSGANPIGTFATNGIPYRSENGNIFNSGNVIPFSKGGIPDVGNNMQYFPLSNGGVGSLRENGKYEAIIPLSRDSTGQLGVKAEGGLANQQNNVYNINVNVSGATDKSNANEVGMQVAASIMAQIADARIANANKLGNQLRPVASF